MSAPKKVQKPSSGEVEEAKPKTPLERATAIMSDLLPLAATARTQSIKLSTVEYAGELSAQLLEHAKQLEGLFKKFKKAVDKKSSPADLQPLFKQFDQMKLFGEKSKAWSVASCECRPICHLSAIIYPPPSNSQKS